MTTIGQNKANKLNDNESGIQGLTTHADVRDSAIDNKMPKMFTFGNYNDLQ